MESRVMVGGQGRCACTMCSRRSTLTFGVGIVLHRGYFGASSIVHHALRVDPNLGALLFPACCARSSTLPFDLSSLHGAYCMRLYNVWITATSYPSHIAIPLLSFPFMGNCLPTHVTIVASSSIIIYIIHHPHPTTTHIHL